MTSGEIFYIGLVLATFAVFSISLIATTLRYDRTSTAAKRREAGMGHPAHA